MASSPLTMALLSQGGMNAMQPYMYDPAAAGEMSRLQLGQGLLNEGLSAAPAYPAQAISRLGQALVGALMLRRGYGDLQSLGAQRAQDAQTTGASLMAPLQSFLGGQSSGGAAQSQPPPAADTGNAPPANYAGGGQTVAQSQYGPFISKTAMSMGIPPQLASAYLQQESNLGTNPAAGSNVGQITFKTAQNPGYGMQPLSPEDMNDPQKNIAWSLQYLKNAGTAAGVKDWGDPSQWGLALRAYNGGGDPNYVQHVARWLPAGTTISDPTGRVQVAQAGNVATDATPGAPSTAAPATGLNAPQIRAGLEVLNRALQIQQRPDYRYNLQLQQQVQSAMEAAKTIMGLHNVQTLPNGLQVDETGKILYPPSQRFVTDASGNVLQGLPGGGAHVVAPNQSGVTGTGPEASALRIMSDLRERVSNGTATPQEVANYNLAAETYQGAQIHEDPVTHALTRVPVRGLPQAFPPIGGATPPVAPQQPNAPQQAATQQPQQNVGNTNAAGVTKLTEGGLSPGVSGDFGKQYQELQTRSQASRDTMQEALLLKDTLAKIGTSGPATESLAELSRLAAQAGVPDETLKRFNLPNGASEAQARALANSLAMEIAKARFPGRVTNTDLQTAMTTKPNPNQPLAASMFLIDNTILPQAQRDVDRFNAVAGITDKNSPDYDVTFGKLPTLLNKFDTDHPLTSYTPKLNDTSGGGNNVAVKGNPIPAASIPQAAIERLKANPSEAALFDKVFGVGASKKYLH